MCVCVCVCVYITHILKFENYLKLVLIYLDN